MKNASIIKEVLTSLRDGRGWLQYEKYNFLAIAALEKKWSWNGRCGACGYASLKAPKGRFQFCRCSVEIIRILYA